MSEDKTHRIGVAAAFTKSGKKRSCRPKSELAARNWHRHRWPVIRTCIPPRHHLQMGGR
jgi:hypothetical protein